jgi:hypothetical protein
MFHDTSRRMTIGGSSSIGIRNNRSAALLVAHLEFDVFPVLGIIGRQACRASMRAASALAAETSPCTSMIRSGKGLSGLSDHRTQHLQQLCCVKRLRDDWHVLEPVYV